MLSVNLTSPVGEPASTRSLSAFGIVWPKRNIRARKNALHLLQRPCDLCQGRAATFLNKLIKRSRCRVLGYSAMGYADMGLGSCFETAGFGAMMPMRMQRELAVLIL